MSFPFYLYWFSYFAYTSDTRSASILKETIFLVIKIEPLTSKICQRIEHKLKVYDTHSNFIPPTLKLHWAYIAPPKQPTMYPPTLISRNIIAHTFFHNVKVGDLNIFVGYTSTGSTKAISHHTQASSFGVQQPSIKGTSKVILLS